MTRPARLAERRAHREQLRADYRERCEREAVQATARADRERREREERRAAERRLEWERRWVEDRRRAEELRRLQEERAILVERRAAIEAGLSVADYRALQAERERLVSILAFREKQLRRAEDEEFMREARARARARRASGGRSLLLPLLLLAAMSLPGDDR
jgi:hypothetical protein